MQAFPSSENDRNEREETPGTPIQGDHSVEGSFGTTEITHADPNQETSSESLLSDDASRLVHAIRERLGLLLHAEEPKKRTLLEIVGVTQTSLDKYQRDLLVELGRIQDFEERILKRSLREQVEEIGALVTEISVNCERDPDDIREEIALPSLLRRVADGLEEYVSIVSRRNRHPEVLERLSATEDMLTQSVPWLTDLLQRMRANDGENALARARVITRIFGSSPEQEGGSNR